MILTAIDNFLGDGPLVRRFPRRSRIATVEMLLHEKIPRYLPLRELPSRKEAWEGVVLPSRHPEVAVNVWRVTAGRGMPRQAHVLGTAVTAC